MSGIYSCPSHFLVGIRAAGDDSPPEAPHEGIKALSHLRLPEH